VGGKMDGRVKMTYRVVDVENKKEGGHLIRGGRTFFFELGLELELNSPQLELQQNLNFNSTQLQLNLNKT
jgi:hypothetical protein